MKEPRQATSKKALVLTDLQNDFLPGGALAVVDGDQTIPVANALIRARRDLFDLVVATQDWHPPNHGSFASNHAGRKPGDIGTLGGLEQVYWPDHCVQNSRGAEFAPGFDRSAVARVFQKGTDPSIDSYSGFFDNAHRRSTGMGEFFKAQGVGEVYLLGLTTDYCVKFSALDSLRLGFRTIVIEDGCRAVNLRPGDDRRSIGELKRAGVRVVRSEELLGSEFSRKAAG